MPSRANKAQQRSKTQPSLWIIQMVVAIDETRSTRQAAQSILQHGVVTLVRNQPEVREGMA